MVEFLLYLNGIVMFPFPATFFYFWRFRAVNSKKIQQKTAHSGIRTGTIDKVYYRYNTMQYNSIPKKVWN